MLQNFDIILLNNIGINYDLLRNLLNNIGINLKFAVKILGEIVHYFQYISDWHIATDIQIYIIVNPNYEPFKLNPKY